MADMKHADLIERLKAGSGCDRDLACDILDHVGICPHREVEHYRVQGDSGYECTKCGKDAGFKDTPDLTRSLDACIGLMREVLPGWDWTISFVQVAEQPCMVSLSKRGNRCDAGYHKEECRAFLIAILQAVGDRHD